MNLRRAIRARARPDSWKFSVIAPEFLNQIVDGGRITVLKFQFPFVPLYRLISFSIITAVVLGRHRTGLGEPYLLSTHVLAGCSAAAHNIHTNGWIPSGKCIENAKKGPRFVVLDTANRGGARASGIGHPGAFCLQCIL